MPWPSETERLHWERRIGRRIDRKIEAVAAGAPGLLERVARQAHERALQSLGLAAMQEELDEVAARMKELVGRDRQARRAMLAAVRRVPPAEIPEEVGASFSEVTQAIRQRQAAHEEELLAADPRGREVLRLRRERENLPDTVWLAKSPRRVVNLWARVAILLGDEPTPLQKEVLAADPGERG
jgi:hypothetical protein